MAELASDLWKMWGGEGKEFFHRTSPWPLFLLSGIYDSYAPQFGTQKKALPLGYLPPYFLVSKNYLRMQLENHRIIELKKQR